MSKKKKIILGIFILIIMVILFNLIKRKLITNDKYVLKYLSEKYDGIEFERAGDYEDYFYKYKHLFSSGERRRNGKLGLKKLFRPVGEEGEEFIVYNYYSGEIKDEYKYKIEHIWKEKYEYNEKNSTANRRKASKILYEFLNPKIEELLDGIEYRTSFYIDKMPLDITLEDYFDDKSYNIVCRIYISEKDLKEENLLKYYETAKEIKKYIEEVYGQFEEYFFETTILSFDNNSFEEIKKYNYNILERIDMTSEYPYSFFYYKAERKINDKGEIVEEIPSYEEFLETYLEQN